MSGLVTSHAVYRWLTRVQKITAAEIAEVCNPRLPEPVQAMAGCRLLGLSMSEAQAEILPASLEPAVRLGATRVPRSGFVLVCRDGLVLTVVLGATISSKVPRPMDLRREAAAARWTAAQWMEAGE